MLDVQPAPMHPALNGGRRVLCKAPVSTVIWTVPFCGWRELFDSHFTGQHLGIAVLQVGTFPYVRIGGLIHGALVVLSLLV